MTDWEKKWSAGDTPWDKGAPAPPLIELLASELGEKIRGRRVLVPGCGSGEDVRELARAGANVTGLDLSASAIERAESLENPDGARFLVGDFFEWLDEPFDVIWEHTCFCAIDPADRGRYAASASRLLAPGGVLAGVFYLQPWVNGEVPDPPPYGSSRSEIVACLGQDFRLCWDKVPDLSYPGREGREWLAVFERVDRNRGVAAVVKGS